MSTANAETRVSLIKTHLFKDLHILRSLKTKRRNYLGRHINIEVVNETETLRYLDVKPDNQIDASHCNIRKNYVMVPDDYTKPITLGLDASYGTQNYIIKGNACYGWVTALSSMVDGNVSEEVMDEVKKLNRYVVMMSDKVFEQKRSSKNCIVPHHMLQENMFNMLKVVEQGHMVAEPLKKMVHTLSAYGYDYKIGDPRRTMIIKDGPLLSGFFDAFGDALLQDPVPERFEDEHRIYKIIGNAGMKGIPVVGLTKNATYSIMAQHFGEQDVLDYSIIKQLAEGDTYFYVGPYERQHTKNPNFKICYYYLFLEDRFSPLRLEILPDLLPVGISPEVMVEDILTSLKASDDGEFEHRGEDYKLPLCIALADQNSRAMVKEESARVHEMLRDVVKKIPGSIIDRRR